MVCRSFGRGGPDLLPDELGGKKTRKPKENTEWLPVWALLGQYLLLGGAMKFR